jgi:hypothetical protein
MGLFSNDEERERKRQEREQKEQELLALYGMQLASTNETYLEGNLPLPLNNTIEFTGYEKGIRLYQGRVFGESFDQFIYYDHLEPIAIRTQEQVYMDVSLGKLILFGPLAFGMKDKRVERKRYLLLNFDEYFGVFTCGWLTPTFVLIVNQARMKYLSSLNKEDSTS